MKKLFSFKRLQSDFKNVAINISNNASIKNSYSSKHRSRRFFLVSSATLGAGFLLLKPSLVSAAQATFDVPASVKDFSWPKTLDKIKTVNLTDAQWKQRLSAKAYSVLRKEDTERPGSSILDKEYSKGEYLCAGCGLLLFTSEMKFDSGTGWPSFFRAVDGHVETKTDFKMIFPRTEYHCVRCGGHQGHLFKDGPKPTGQRWCNNGVALHFVKSKA